MIQKNQISKSKTNNPQSHRVKHHKALLTLIVPLALLLMLAMSRGGVSAESGANKSTVATNSDSNLMSSVARLAAPSATITGDVFRDYDADGIKDSGEPALTGVSGITVTAYDSSNVSVGTTTVVETTGSYSLSATGSGPFRIEFTGLPTWLKSTAAGTNNGTTVQFVGDGGTADLGVQNPGQYCLDSANTEVITSHFIAGDQSAVNDALVSLSYDRSGALNHIATTDNIGATWGLAWSRSSKTIFAGAYLKRHVGFGPDGIDAIYTINYDPTSSIVSYGPIINLFDDLGVNVGADPRPGNVAVLPAAPAAPSHDEQSFTQVGKVGLGDIEISEDDSILYAMNLGGREVVALDITDVNNVSLIAQYAITDPGCSDAEYQPYGLKVLDGDLYIGITCTAETSQDKADLHAYVQKLAGTTFVPVYDLTLDYPRSAVYGNQSLNRFFPAEWNPWVDDFTDFTPTGARDDIRHPQPLLADIEFDVEGSMILGFMDRTGDQMGHLNFSPDTTDTTTLYRTTTGGDMLRLCNNNGSFELEGTGSCPSNFTGAPHHGTGTATADGGEYYDDNTLNTSSPTGDRHDEVAMGGLSHLWGTGEIFGTTMDPIGFNSGGWRWYNNQTGAVTASYIVYQSNGRVADGTFGKANGLGDAELLCAAAPIEVGNRLWCDSGSGNAANGIQDAGESGVGAGVDVVMTCGGQSATVTTDADGNYLFTNAIWAAVNGGDDIPRDTSCTISIDTTGSNGTALTNACGTATPTLADQTPVGDGNDDIRDSDGMQNGNNVEVTFTTGGAGENDHTFDFGFGQAQTYSLGDLVWYDQNQDGIQDANEPGFPGVTATLYNDATCTTPMGPTDITDAAGDYGFTGLAAGTYSVQFTVPAGYTVSPLEVAGDTANSDADATGCIPNITLGPDDPDEDMGIYMTGSLGDQVWCEDPTIANTTYDPGDGDTPIANIGVSLYTDPNCDGNRADGTLVTGMTNPMDTDASGFYSFTGLEVMLFGDPDFATNQTCYVTEVDTADPALGSCDQPITDVVYDDELTTDDPDDDTNDFGFQEPQVYDFGDAPDKVTDVSYPNQTILPGGARHLLNSPLVLGTCVDSEADGVPVVPPMSAELPAPGLTDDGSFGTPSPFLPSPTACIGVDDEDGFVGVNDDDWSDGSGSLDVQVSGVSGNACVYGWIDFDQDGFDAGDATAQLVYAADGTQTMVFGTNVPVGSIPVGVPIYVRLRVVPGACGTLDPIGLATGGEIEDHDIQSTSPTAIGFNGGAVDMPTSDLIWIVTSVVLLMLAWVWNGRRKGTIS